MSFNKKSFLRILKIIFEVLLFIMFVGTYFKILTTIESNISLKFIFSITYIWFTIGMNVNFVLPLLKIIDNKIKNI